MNSPQQTACLAKGYIKPKPMSNSQAHCTGLIDFKCQMSQSHLPVIKQVACIRLHRKKDESEICHTQIDLQGVHHFHHVPHLHLV